MIIPKTIKIGSTKYKVSLVKVVDYMEMIKMRFRKEKGIIFGRIDGQEIRIKKDLNNKHQKETFFHEMAHGIMWEMERSHPKVWAWRKDEAFICKLGSVLSRTFSNLMKSQVP